MPKERGLHAIQKDCQPAEQDFSVFKRSLVMPTSNSIVVKKARKIHVIDHAIVLQQLMKKLFCWIVLLNK